MRFFLVGWLFFMCACFCLVGWLVFSVCMCGFCVESWLVWGFSCLFWVFLDFSGLSPSYSGSLSYSLQAENTYMTSKHKLELQHPVATQDPTTWSSVVLGDGAGFHGLRHIVAHHK